MKNEVIQLVLEEGCYVVSDRECYRLEAPSDSDQPFDIKPPLLDLRQPGWPGQHSASDYAKLADQLRLAAKERKVPYRLALGEAARAVDCRLAELFYYLARYPENHWVVYGKQLSFSKKLKMAKRLLPKEWLPRTLLRHTATERNLIEHQYSEPDPKDTSSYLETMHAFLVMTTDLLDVVRMFSLFLFDIADDAPQRFAVQFLRDKGKLAIFRDGDMPEPENEIDTASKEGLALVEKVVKAIATRLRTDPAFLSKLGFAGLR